MDVEVHVEGLAHLSQVLAKELPARGQAKVIGATTRRALKPMQEAIKRGYRQGRGSHSLAVATRIWSRRLASKQRRVKGFPTVARIEVGPKRSVVPALQSYYAFYDRTVTARQLTLGIRHGHLVEWGYQHARGGHVAGKHVLLKAFDQNIGQTIALFRKYYGNYVKNELPKIRAKQKKGR